jgi:hypothetical protein
MNILVGCDGDSLITRELTTREQIVENNQLLLCALVFVTWCR